MIRVGCCYPRAQPAAGKPLLVARHQGSTTQQHARLSVARSHKKTPALRRSDHRLVFRGGFRSYTSQYINVAIIWNLAYLRIELFRNDDLTATNSTMERSFSYDHAGRLTSARSGSEAAGQGGTPTGPFMHTYGLNAFENLTSRGGRNGYVGVTSLPINYNATYVNDRNTAWTYNDSGNVLIADQQQYQWDAAGQMHRAQTVNLYLYQDGDGQDVLRSLDGVDTYYIRSRVLGGLVVGEINVNGAHQRTYIYANGRRIARQKNGNTYWLSQDPANVTNVETDTSGEIWARAQLDPLGVLTGTGQSVIPPGGSFNTSGYYGNAGSPGDGCRLDGAPFPCDWLARLVNSGDSVRCPNKDCGPIPKRDKQGNPTGGFESFRALADGNQGWLSLTAVYLRNGGWYDPVTGEEGNFRFGGSLGVSFLSSIDLSGGQTRSAPRGTPPPSDDCHRFADIVSRMANALNLHLVRDDDLSGAVQTFMDRLAVRFTEFTGASYFDAGKAALLGITNEHFNPSEFGSGGFAASYFEADSITPSGRHVPNNQVRHAVGGMLAGYVRGEATGLRQMQEREDPNDPIHGVPDINLNNQTVPMGARIAGRQGHINAATLGQWIRDTLCAH